MVAWCMVDIRGIVLVDVMCYSLDDVLWMDNQVVLWKVHQVWQDWWMLMEHIVDNQGIVRMHNDVHRMNMDMEGLLCHALNNQDDEKWQWLL